MSTFYFLILGALFVLGVITGGLSNVTSGGAGVFTIFVLSRYAALSIQQSIGTVLASSTIMVLIGAIAFYRKKQVDGQLSITLGLSGVLGAFAAARFAASVESLLLERGFGAFTLFIAAYTAFQFVRSTKRRLVNKSYSTLPNGQIIAQGTEQDQAQFNNNTSRWRGRDPLAVTVQVAFGIALGVATGLFGVGGGGLTMAALLLVFKLRTKLMIGTSLLSSFFRYAGGSLGYLTAGSVDPLTFVILTIGGGLGSIAGARFVMSRRTKDSYIQLILVVLFIFISYEFLVK